MGGGSAVGVRAGCPSRVVWLFWSLIGFVATHEPLLGHGGVYRGPGTGVPAGGTPATGAPAASGTPGGATTGDTSDWQTWWSFNRDPFLNLKEALHREAATTGAGDYFDPPSRDASALAGRPQESDLDRAVVPALVRALGVERSDDLRSAASIALAKIGRAPTGTSLQELFAPLLDDPSQEIAETAAISLGVAADARSAPLLTSLLEGGPVGQELTGRSEVPYRTRAFAAYGLGLIGARSPSEDVRRYVVHVLIRALERDESASRDIRVACLLSLGLVRLDPSERVPDPAAPEPPTASREALIEYLLAFFQNRKNHELERGHVPVALARLAVGVEPGLAARIARVLCAAVDATPREGAAVQHGAVSALAHFGDDDQDEIDRTIRQTLSTAAIQGDRAIRYLALVSLARVAARRGTGADPDVGVNETRTFLLRRLEKAETVGRPWSALALGILERTRQDAGEAPSAEIAAAVRAAMEGHPGPVEAGAYSIAAGLMRDPRARDLLLARAKDPSDDTLRGYACVALGLMQATEAVETLRTIARDSKYRPGVLRDAAVGLGLIGDKEIVPVLLEQLREARSLAATAAITSALGFVGDRRAVDPLVAMVDDAELDLRTRAFAAAALGIVCDKEPLPWNSKLATDVNYWLPPATLWDPGTAKGILDLL